MLNFPGLNTGLNFAKFSVSFFNKKPYFKDKSIGSPFKV